MHVWSKLSAAKWIDAWEERFAGNPNLVINYLKGGKSVRLQLYCESLQEAQKVSAQWGGSIRKVVHSDWQCQAPAPAPIKIRDALLLTQEAESDALQQLRDSHPQRHLISIPPEMAFGTGDHATTSTCLRLLVDVARQRQAGTWSMADLGTGTAVLAIAAHKMGAREIYACDFDPFAVTVAQSNLQRNGVDGVTIKTQDVLKWKPRKKGYDVVVANLFSTVLIEAWPVIGRTLAPGGDLIVSGILASQAWEVFKAAAAQGLGFPQVIKKGKWVTARGGHMNDLSGH